jgi:hypothetical protein
MKEFVDAISQVGFPIVVALLLLIRIESKQEKFGEKMDTMGQKLDRNTEATNKLASVIDERIPKRR